VSKTKRKQVVRRRRSQADIEYRDRQKILRAEQKAKREAPLQFITAEDKYLYTYRPDTSVCVEAM
jgi:hypothetical protein